MTTNSDSPKPHVRRPRYRGTHPRQFREKYKEHNPDQYADDIERVMARGQTPAGMHRPICVNEIIDILRPEPGCICLDATLGFGGHARALLSRILPGGHLYGLDVDAVELSKTEKRLQSEGFVKECLTIHKSNFAGIGQLLSDEPEGFNCILADLGVSSMQLDNPARGFSYKLAGPLDLRLNPDRGQSAAELLHTIKEQKLKKLLFENADEPHATAIAKAICAAPEPILTTTQLSDTVRNALMTIYPKGTLLQSETKKSQQRTFMALRITVNDEFGVLDRFLEQLPLCLKPEGRVAIISFHSGEDRRVKKSFKEGVRNGLYSEVVRSPIRPSAEEQRNNPRSSCAKLRWAVRSAVPAV